MNLIELQTNRNLNKDSTQVESTQGAVYASVNPSTPANAPGDYIDTNGTAEVQTGTVITSCIIQTSALPSRAELSGNDLTLFDDTTVQNGAVVGDTSRIVFTHDSGKTGANIIAGFIFEKRASVFNTYDNVLSLYSPPAPSGAHNYIFFGRNATEDDEELNVSSIHMAINGQSDFVPEPGNPPLDGVFEVEYSEDGVIKASPIYTGKSSSLFPGAGVDGYSSIITGGEGGLSGLGYTPVAGGLNVLLYLTDESTITVGAKVLPDTDGAYDLGSDIAHFRNLFLSGNIFVPQLFVGSAVSYTTGTGSPAGVVAANVGSIYTDQAGGATTTLYVKTSGGGGPTGWTAK